MGMRETQRKLLAVLRTLERDHTRLAFHDFYVHVSYEAGIWWGPWHFVVGRRFGLVHRRESDHTVTVAGALAMDADTFARMLPEAAWWARPACGAGSLGRAPPLDSDTRARVERQLAEDAARCEAADVIMDPPFLPPHLRTATQQRLWKNPYIRTYTAEAWSSEADRAVWIEAFPAGISYEVHTVDTGVGRWGVPRPQGMFGTLDDALAYVAICRAGDD
jgi:hypothetical protein